jgi:hypothetical protein
VRKIAPLLNVTRLYNAVCAVSGMRRAIALAEDYARHRVAFGRPLAEQPLHVETLAAMVVEYGAGLQLAFHIGQLLGREECGEASPDESRLLRLLTPAVKLYTAKQAVALASETLEAFGGAGYVEDTGLPRLLRDAQVLSIWEGTTNVLALDVLRALGASDALEVFVAAVERRLAAIDDPALAASVPRVADALRRIVAHAASAHAAAADDVQAAARAFAFSIARTFAAALLLEHAQWSARHERDGRAITVAVRWCASDLAPVAGRDAAHRRASNALIDGTA